MTGAGGLDVRLPIGGLFVVLGLLLAGYGVATAGDAARYARSLSVNINLWWGLVMVVSGCVILGMTLASPRRRAQRNAAR